MANQTLVRHINERRLLNALRVNGPLPRAELARRLSLTRAAVTSMVDDLLARAMVRESADAPQKIRRDVGRPGTEIELHPDAAFFLGVEIGVGALRFALINLAAQTVLVETHRLPPHPDPRDIVARVTARLADLRETPAFAQGIRGLCVTVPGLVRADGHVVNLPILGWKGVELLRLLEAAIDLPCHVENNANAAAFGHVYAHPAPARDVLVYLKIGNGCGGAAIIDDRLLRGASGFGAEFGHLRIAADGPPCDCGGRGCLETFINLKALHRYFSGQEIASDATDPALPERIARALASGDPAAERAVGQLATHLATALIDIANIFNPGEIVLGGAMLPILDAVVERAAPLLARGIVPGMTLPALIVSGVGDHECAIGAAALAHHEEFDLSNLDLRA